MNYVTKNKMKAFWKRLAIAILIWNRDRWDNSGGQRVALSWAAAWENARILIEAQR